VSKYTQSVIKLDGLDVGKFIDYGRFIKTL